MGDQKVGWPKLPTPPLWHRPCRCRIRGKINHNMTYETTPFMCSHENYLCKPIVHLCWLCWIFEVTVGFLGDLVQYGKKKTHAFTLREPKACRLMCACRKRARGEIETEVETEVECSHHLQVDSARARARWEAEEEEECSWRLDDDAAGKRTTLVADDEQDHSRWLSANAARERTRWQEDGNWRLRHQRLDIAQYHTRSTSSILHRVASDGSYVDRLCNGVMDPQCGFCGALGFHRESINCSWWESLHSSSMCCLYHNTNLTFSRHRGMSFLWAYSSTQQFFGVFTYGYTYKHSTWMWPHTAPASIVRCVIGLGLSTLTKNKGGSIHSSTSWRAIRQSTNACSIVLMCHVIKTVCNHCWLPLKKWAHITMPIVPAWLKWNGKKTLHTTYVSCL